MSKKKIRYILLILCLSLFLFGCEFMDEVIPQEESSPIGTQIESSTEAINVLLDGIENQNQYIYCYTTDTFESQEVTNAINRKVLQAKKTYDMCNIKGCVMRTTRKTNYTEIEIEMRYYMSKSEYEYVNNRVKTISENLKRDSDYETYKAIYDWICTHVSYDYDTVNGDANRFSAYNALKDGKAVCYGYAALYQKFCDELGLECIVLTSLDDTAHAWNVVKLNGQYYHVDTTFGTQNGKPDYEYFLCGKDRITYGSGYGIDLATQSYVIPQNN